MVVGSTTQNQVEGNGALLLFREQSNISFALGNSTISQPNTIRFNNPFASHISSSGALGLSARTGSINLNGSGSIIINDILQLTPRNTTPSSPTNGMLIVSGSGADQHIYCYLNNTWKQLD